MSRGLLLAALLMLAGCSGGTGPATRIVLVTFDTTRADRLGCYGNADALTPNLDRFAAEGTLFEQAVAQTPTTLPSHATILTGVYPQDHGIRYNLMFRLAPEALTLAERLREAGFATAGFPAAYVLDRQFGLAQGFDTYVDPPAATEADRAHPDSVLRPAAEGVDLALDWLEAHPAGKRFVWLHFFEPHQPYKPPFPFSAQYRNRPYDGEIAYTDEQFGRLYDRLREDGDWDRTLLLVAGDHGEGLFEHQEGYHAYLVYETTQRVPLIVHAPGGTPSRTNEPVALADIVPTIMDLAGLPVPQGLRGISLRPALEGRPLARRDLYFESLSGALNYGWAELKGVRSGSWKLIDSSDPELYDLDEDPAETVNLANLEPERLGDLRAALHELAEPLGGSVLPQEAHDPVLDAETQMFLASLGYVGSASGGGSSEMAVHPREIIDLSVELLNAQKAVAEQRWEAVLDLARYVLTRDPANKWALSESILAHIHLGSAVEAQDVGAEFVRLYPDNERAYSRWATACAAAGQTETAYEILQRGLRAVPDSESLAYLYLVAAFGAGHDDVCEKELPTIQASHGESALLLVLQARCAAEAGDPRAALATLNRALVAGFDKFEVLERAEEFREVVALPGWASLVAAGRAARDEQP